MTITESDFAFRKPVQVSDASSNGGRMGTLEIVHDVKNNCFPDVTQAQRLAGLTRHRKIFALIENADDLALQNAFAHLSRVSEGDDYVSLFAGSQRDTQGDISSPRVYAIAPLATSPAAGASAFDLTLEHTSLAAGFQDGDSIWIGDDDGGEYFHNATFSINGSTVSVTLDTGDALADAYTAGDARCATLLPATEDVQTSSSDWAESSASGSYDEAAYPVRVPAIGGVEDDWLLTFSSTTEYAVEGTYTGALASGSISADYTPANPDGGSYFTLSSAGWSGSWQAGDTVSFSTHPASLPVWITQVVPAGAAAISLTGTELMVTGESA